MGAFLSYASGQGQALINRELYLPEGVKGQDRHEQAGVSEQIGTRTKLKLPNGMLGRTLDAGVEAAWVVADSVCGDSRGLRMFPEEWEQTKGQHIEASLKGASLKSMEGTGSLLW